MSWYLIIPFFFLIFAFVIRMPIGLGMLAGSIAYYMAKGLSLGSLLNTVCYGLTNAYILIAIPTPRNWLRQAVRRAWTRALPNAGRSRPSRKERMLMTTSSSMSVNAGLLWSPTHLNVRVNFIDCDLPFAFVNRAAAQCATILYRSDRPGFNG